LRDEIANIGEPLLATEQFNEPTLFVNGTKSGYIVKEDETLIKQHFPNSSITNLNCGHWVHAEMPAKFLEIVNIFFV
jgi:hypothetical protein